MGGERSWNWTWFPITVPLSHISSCMCSDYCCCLDLTGASCVHGGEQIFQCSHHKCLTLHCWNSKSIKCLTFTKNCHTRLNHIKEGSSHSGKTHTPCWNSDVRWENMNLNVKPSTRLCLIFMSGQRIRTVRSIKTFRNAFLEDEGEQRKSTSLTWAEQISTICNKITSKGSRHILERAMVFPGPRKTQIVPFSQIRRDLRMVHLSVSPLTETLPPAGRGGC